MEIKIITKNGFTRIEMPSDISERELLNAKNLLDRTLQERTEEKRAPKLSFCKKCTRFIRRLYHQIKKSLSAEPRRTEITVFRPLLIEAAETNDC